MFRTIVLPIIRSIRVYNAACGMKHSSELSVGCQATYRQLTGCFIPQAALYSLMLLMMGKTVCPKHVELMRIY